MNDQPSLPQTLLAALRELIAQGRQRALRAVDMVQVQTCWEIGKGFDASNLRYMRLFYQAFPMCDALRHELSWTHYRMLLRVESAEARQRYIPEWKRLFAITNENPRKIG